MNDESKARQAIIKNNMEEDLIAKGFKKLDSKLISQKPPKITWGKIYQNFTDKEKIEYLEKLASTMNHAAYLIQEERNTAFEMVEQKEEQIIMLKEAIEANDKMVQTEIRKINEERQKFNRVGAGLKGDALKEKIKEWQLSPE